MRAARRLVVVVRSRIRRGHKKGVDQGSATSCNCAIDLAYNFGRSLFAMPGRVIVGTIEGA